MKNTEDIINYLNDKILIQKLQIKELEARIKELEENEKSNLSSKL